MCGYGKSEKNYMLLVIVSDIIHVHMHMYVLSNNCV